METLSVSQFKTTCLSVLDQVSRQKKKVLITKRGKPIAEIIPVAGPGEKISLKDTVTFMGDIISPVAVEDWEALQ
jgi:prevent-host-death family protein